MDQNEKPQPLSSEEEGKKLRNSLLWTAMTGFIGVGGADNPVGLFKKGDIRKILKQYLIIGAILLGIALGIVVYIIMKTDCSDYQTRMSNVFCQASADWFSR